MSKFKNFTQEEKDLMVKLYKKGMNFTEIGKEIGRARTSVGTFLKNMGYTPKSRNGSSHVFSIGEVVNESLLIVKHIKVKNGNYTCKGYVVKSLNYPDDKNDYEISEYNLKNGQGCGYTAGKRVCSESSLWSKTKYREYIIDIEEAKQISYNSAKEIMFRCPCGEEKKMKVYNFVNHKFRCSTCSKGISYPEQMLMSYLKVKNIEYEYQVKFDNSLRRIDFKIILDGNIYFLECNGLQHYQKISDGGTWINAYERTVKSDNIKKQYAKDNDIKIIWLDCRESSFKFIQHSIFKNEHLPNINNNEIDKMLKLMEDNSKYDIELIVKLYTIDKLSTVQIAKLIGVSHSTIGKILKNNGVKIRNHGKKTN